MRDFLWLRTLLSGTNLAAAALLLATSPALAQHPGGIGSAGGGAMHAAPAGRGVAMPSAPHVPAPHLSAPHVSGPSSGAPPRLSPGQAPHFSSSVTRHGATANGQEGNWGSFGFIPASDGNGYGTQGHPHNGERDHNRNRVGYGYGVVGYPVFAYGYGGLGYGEEDSGAPVQQNGGNGYVDPAAAQSAQPAAQYDPQSGPPQPGPQYGPLTAGPYDTARPAYNPAASAEAARVDDQTRSDGLNHPKVTLVFKDGRAPIKIQNYAMTSTRLFVRDSGAERDIPISDLDVPATLTANDDAGVPFELPQTP